MLDGFLLALVLVGVPAVLVFGPGPWRRDARWTRASWALWGTAAVLPAVVWMAQAAWGPFATDASPSNLHYAWTLPLGASEAEGRHTALLLAVLQGVLWVWDAVGQPRELLEPMARAPGLLAWAAVLGLTWRVWQPVLGGARTAAVMALVAWHPLVGDQALEVSDHPLHLAATMLLAVMVFAHLRAPSVRTRVGLGVAVVACGWTSLLSLAVLLPAIGFVLWRDRSATPTLLSWPLLAAGFALVPIVVLARRAVRHDVDAGAAGGLSAAPGWPAVEGTAAEAAAFLGSPGSMWLDALSITSSPLVGVGFAVTGVLVVIGGWTLARRDGPEGPWAIALTVVFGLVVLGAAVVRVKATYLTPLVPWWSAALVVALTGLPGSSWTPRYRWPLLGLLLYAVAVEGAQHREGRLARAMFPREAAAHVEAGVPWIVPFEPDLWMLRWEICDDPLEVPTVPRPLPWDAPIALCSGGPDVAVYTLPEPGVPPDPERFEAGRTAAGRPHLVVLDAIQPTQELRPALASCAEVLRHPRHALLRCDAP